MKHKFDNCLYFWSFYEYADRPLCFIQLLEGDEKLPADAVVAILSLIDEWYGNTEQETIDWALEYQLLTRMLLCRGALLVNPKHLDLSDMDVETGTNVPHELANILQGVSLKALHAYDMARALTQEEINSLDFWKEGPHDVRERTDMTKCAKRHACNSNGAAPTQTKVGHEYIYLYASDDGDCEALALHNARKCVVVYVPVSTEAELARGGLFVVTFEDGDEFGVYGDELHPVEDFTRSKFGIYWPNKQKQEVDNK